MALPPIVGLLPTLLHLSLFLFLIGLVVFLFTLDYAIGAIVACITLAALSVYLITNITPLHHPQCLYKTPMSNYASRLKPLLVGLLPAKLQRGEWLDWAQAVHTLNEMESKAVEDQGEDLSYRMFGWLCRTSANTSVLSVLCQAVGDLPLEASGKTVLRNNLLPHVCASVELVCPPSLLVSKKRIESDDKYLSSSETSTLSILLKIHLHLTLIHKDDGLSGHHMCYCSADARQIIRIISHPSRHLLEHVCISSFHFHHGKHSDSPSLDDLLAFQPPRASKREWISLLQTTALSAQCSSWSMTGEDPGPGTWARSTPLIRLLFKKPGPGKFSVRQGWLLAAVLARYTQPSFTDFGFGKHGAFVRTFWIGKHR